MASKISSLHDLLLHELRDLYDAEHRIVRALPKMIKMGSHEELCDALEQHLEVTKGQIERLEEVFEELDETPKKTKCAGMMGIIEEGETLLSAVSDEATCDAAIIAAAQKVEHYEIASYGCCRTWAEILGFERAAELLQETLDEEGEADKLLTEIAERIVNVESAAETDEDVVPVWRGGRQPAGARAGNDRRARGARRGVRGS